MILLITQVSILKSLLRSTSSSILDKEYQEKCMKYEYYEYEECQKYWNSNKTFDLSLVWKLYYVQSESNVNYYKLLSDYEVNGKCCGFGVPLRCKDDSSEINSIKYDIISKKVKDVQRYDIFSSSRVCGSTSTEDEIEQSWYLPVKGVCEDISNINQDNNVTYGCRYEYPLGKCAFTTQHDKGCAMTLENSLRSKVVPPCKSLLGFTLLVRLMAVFIAYCMIMKRKREDFIPNLDDFDQPTKTKS